MGILKTALLLTAALVIVLLVSRSIRKAACVVAGYGLYALFGELYDTVLWPVIQGAYGINGAIGMSLGAVAINFTVLSVYQRQKVDWLGVSVMDALMNRSADTVNCFRNHPSWAGAFLFIPARIIQFLARGLKTPWLAFVILSTLGDSFLTTAFMRQGRFDPLERRDMVIFFASSLVSCGFWAVWNAGVVAVFQQLWRTIT
jgi:hypothetical protein